MKLSVLNLALLANGASAFTTVPNKPTASQLSMSTEDDRRSFVSKAAGAAAAVAFGLVQGPVPAQAFGGGGLKKVNAKLVQ
jgi:hypothetical protein